MESSIKETKDTEKEKLNENPNPNPNENQNENQNTKLINPELKNLMKEEKNKRCNDCGKENPKFVSINNGVFICDRCMNNHRSYGLNVSVVRSIENDSWNDLQIAYLKKGGNENFRNLINEYYFPLNTPVYNIYRSKAAQFHRNLLKDFVLSELDDKYQSENFVKPDIKEGIELIPENEMKYVNYNNELMGIYSSYIPPKNENILNKVTGTLSSIGGQIERKMDQFKITEKTKKVGNLIVGNKYVQGITGKTKNLYNSIINKVFKKKEKEEDNKNEQTKVQVDISNMENDKKNESDNKTSDNTPNYSQVSKEENSKVNEDETKKESKGTALAEVEED